MQRAIFQYQGVAEPLFTGAAANPLGWDAPLSLPAAARLPPRRILPPIDTRADLAINVTGPSNGQPWHSDLYIPRLPLPTRPNNLDMFAPVPLTMVVTGGDNGQSWRSDLFVPRLPLRTRPNNMDGSEPPQFVVGVNGDVDYSGQYQPRPRARPSRPEQLPIGTTDPGAAGSDSLVVTWIENKMGQPNPRAHRPRVAGNPPNEARSYFWGLPTDTPIDVLALPPRVATPRRQPEDQPILADVSSAYWLSPAMSLPPRGHSPRGAAQQPIERATFDPQNFRDAQAIGWWCELSRPVPAAVQRPHRADAAELTGETTDLAFIEPSGWAPPLSSPVRQLPRAPAPAVSQFLSDPGSAIPNDLLGGGVGDGVLLMRRPPARLPGEQVTPEFTDIPRAAWGELDALSQPVPRRARPTTTLADGAEMQPQPVPPLPVDFVSAVVSALPQPGGRRPAAIQPGAVDPIYDSQWAVAPVIVGLAMRDDLPGRRAPQPARLAAGDPPPFIDVGRAAAPIDGMAGGRLSPHRPRTQPGLDGAELTGSILVAAPTPSTDWLPGLAQPVRPRVPATILTDGAPPAGQLSIAADVFLPDVLGELPPRRPTPAAQPRADFPPLDAPTIPLAVMAQPLAAGRRSAPATQSDAPEAPPTFQVLSGLESMIGPLPRQRPRYAVTVDTLLVDRQYFPAPDPSGYTAAALLPPRRARWPVWQPIEVLTSTGNPAAFTGSGQVIVAATDLWVLAPAAASIEVSQRGGRA